MDGVRAEPGPNGDPPLLPHSHEAPAKDREDRFDRLGVEQRELVRAGGHTERVGVLHLHEEQPAVGGGHGEAFVARVDVQRNDVLAGQAHQVDAFLLFTIEPLQFPRGCRHDDVRPGDGQGRDAMSERLQALSEEQGDARQAGAVHGRAPRPGD